MGFCIGCFGHHEQSRRVFVYSVHKAEARVADIIVGGVAEMPCESVDERAGIVAVSRMHYKSGRLLKPERQKFVHTQQFLALVCYESEMFV